MSVDKFRRDMNGTGVRYGLMVSLASRITGMQGPMFIEETADFTAIYLSHSGLEGVNLISAAALLKAIMAYHSRVESAARIPAGAIEQAWHRIGDEIEALKEVAKQVRGFRDRVREVEQILVREFDDLADSASIVGVKLSAAVDRVVAHLRQELEALPTADKVPALLPASNPDDGVAVLDEMERAKDKRAPAIRGLTV